MQDTMFNHTPATPSTDTDHVAATLQSVAQTILVVVFGLLPILFIPSLVAPFGYSKSLIAVAAVSIALIFYALSCLRFGELTIRFTPGLYTLWGVVAAAGISTLFSGDIRDSLIGDAFSIHTVAFLFLIAATASAITILRDSKKHIIRLLTLITVSALVLGVFHLLRLFLGAPALSFGLFTSPVSSMIGPWNDVALFFGLAVLLALVAVEQLPLTKWGRIVLIAVTALSLILLAVINFFMVWLVLAITSLVVLMYAIVKPRFKNSTLSLEQDNSSSVSVVLSTGVFIVSALFVVGGSFFGSWISDATNISYVEVRPSFSATMDIAGAVYKENAFVGIGPNKFMDAWRLYKDPSINQTVFWDTNFQAGNGYITTSMITSGVLGVLAWFVFLGFLVYSGCRMLLRVAHADRFWFFVGTASFVASVYLWGMSLIYVPTVSILMLAAVCTGLLYTAYGVLIPQRTVSLSIAEQKRTGFILVVITVLIIVSSVSTMYFVGRHYSGIYTFNQARAAVAVGASIDEVEKMIANAYEISKSDRFAREIADYQLARLNALLTLQELTDTQRQQFESAAVNGVNAAQLAVDADPKEPRNWQTLGQLYSVFVAAGVDGSKERAIEALNTAESLHPASPVYPLLRAQVALRSGDIETARAEANAALALKRDLTEAITFLLQVDIAAGDIKQAIARTESLVRLEPQNPARYYQLGVLYSSDQDIDRAIAAFRQAVRIDEKYANARYFLALALAEKGDKDGALEQLTVVRDLNPDNEQVKAIIAALESGEYQPTPTNLNPVAEPQAVSSDGTSVTTTEATDSDLVSTVNTVPDESDEETEDSELVEEEMLETASSTDTEELETGAGAGR